MNIKAILASTVISAFVVGTPAMAADNAYLFSDTRSVVSSAISSVNFRVIGDNDSAYSKPKYINTKEIKASAATSFFGEELEFVGDNSYLLTNVESPKVSESVVFKKINYSESSIIKEFVFELNSK